MDRTEGSASRELMDTFLRFNKLHWHHRPTAGLRHSELLVLNCIYHEETADSPGINVSKISNILKVTSPTITQMVNCLEAKGLVGRSIDKEDRRGVRVSLTDHGACIIKKATADLLTSFNELVEYLGEDNSKKLIELLSSVFTYFNEVKQQKSP
jgi:DNA-binding MarR family transcriptional regulator